MNKKFSFAQCAVVLLACTAIVSVGILLYMHRLTNTLEKETLLALQEFAQQDAQHIEMQVSEDLDLLASVATAISVLPDHTEAGMTPFLKAEKNQNHFKNMEFATIRGTSQLDNGEFLDLSQEEHFQKAVNGTPNISERVTDLTDGANILVAAVPVFQDNQIIGVLMGTRNTTDLGKTLDMQSFGGAGYSLLVDADGDKVVESFHKNAVSGLYNIFDMPDDPDHQLRHQVLKDFKDRKSGTVKYVSQKRGVLYISYQPLHINDWYLLSVVPEKHIIKVTQSFLTMLPVLCLLIAIAAFILGSYMCYAWPILRQELSNPHKD
ncbi:MAG: cache domain-containing protein [Elusimicrobiaceae bacterium]|nr:cache domain-containing protein [Elusimicrobiaceae bacterium]